MAIDRTRRLLLRDARKPLRGQLYGRHVGQITRQARRLGHDSGHLDVGLAETSKRDLLNSELNAGRSPLVVIEAVACPNRPIHCGDVARILSASSSGRPVRQLNSPSSTMRFDFTWNFEFLVDNESKSKVAQHDA